MLTLRNTFLLVCLLFLTGCENPFSEEARQARLQEKISKAVEKANLKAENDLESAAANFNALTKDYPESEEVWESAGFFFLKKEDFSQAGKHFAKAASLSDNSKECYLYAAKAFIEDGDWEGATEFFKKYLKVFPQDSAIHKELAQTYLFLNNKKAALDSYFNYLKQNEPTDEDATAIGSLFLSIPLLSQSEKWFNKALSLNPENKEALLGKIKIALLENNWPSLELNVDVLNSIDPDALKNADLLEANDKAQAWKSLKQLHENFRKEQESKRLAKEAEEKARIEQEQEQQAQIAKANPTSTDLENQARKTFLDKNYEKAALLYQKLISKGHSDSQHWNALSECFFQLGQYTQAEMTALEAIRKAPDNLKYTLQFLKITQKTQPPQRFLEEVVAAKDRFPEAYAIYLILGQAHEKIDKNRTLAREAFRNFLKYAPKAHPKYSEITKKLKTLP